LILSSRSAYHASALFRAALAFIGAALTVIHFVLATFNTTGFANVSTDAADLLHELRTAAHVGSRRKADLGAISIKPDTFRHFCDISFAEAGVGAMLAFLRAPQTSVDAGLVLLVGHDISL
jgi:hypothetical protein